MKKQRIQWTMTWNKGLLIRKHDTVIHRYSLPYFLDFRSTRHRAQILRNKFVFLLPCFSEYAFLWYLASDPDSWLREACGKPRLALLDENPPWWSSADTCPSPASLDEDQHLWTAADTCPSAYVAQACVNRRCFHYFSNCDSTLAPLICVPHNVSNTTVAGIMNHSFRHGFVVSQSTHCGLIWFCVLLSCRTYSSGPFSSLCFFSGGNIFSPHRVVASLLHLHYVSVVFEFVRELGFGHVSVISRTMVPMRRETRK